jgi:CBS domain-containing protein
MSSGPLAAPFNLEYSANAQGVTTMSTRLVLQADSAGELMSPNPVSIHATATVSEAVALLVDRGIHAAPVIDEAGRPIGVISTGDILRHDRAYTRHLERVPQFYSVSELRLPSGERMPGKGFQVEAADNTTVRDIMTPAVFSVPKTTTPALVVKQMTELHVHRLFVVDGSGVLIGVISTLDVMRKLGL